MSDILSQEEVDALLSAVSTGDFEPSTEESGSADSTDPNRAGLASFDNDDDELASKAVALYDFRRPDRVSKEQLRTLQNLHEGYARLLSTTLTSYLRTLVEIELVSVDQLTYQEVIMSISSPSCIYIFQMEPLEGSAILEMNPSLMFLMLDRLFGGLGKSAEQNRELTDIERAVINKIIERALVDLKEVWENIGIFSPKIESYETNPQFVQIAPPGETVILISLEVRLKNGSGLMSLCFPFIILESIIDKLTGESWISAQKTTTQETRRLVERELSETTVEVSCKIGNVALSVRDFMQLQKNDIIVLDKNASSDLVVCVSGKAKFLGKPGVVGRNKSVQITSIIDREVGDYE
jgi:flagellar motor switch protein FliM